MEIKKEISVELKCFIKDYVSLPSLNLTSNEQISIKSFKLFWTAITNVLANHGLTTFGPIRRAKRVREFKTCLLFAGEIYWSSGAIFPMIKASLRRRQQESCSEACLLTTITIHKGSTHDAFNFNIIRSVIDTNVIRLAFCTREALKSTEAGEVMKTLLSNGGKEVLLA